MHVFSDQGHILLPIHRFRTLPGIRRALELVDTVHCAIPCLEYDGYAVLFCVQIDGLTSDRADFAYKRVCAP